ESEISSYTHGVFPPLTSEQPKLTAALTRLSIETDGNLSMNACLKPTSPANTSAVDPGAMANWRNDGRMANNDRTTRPYTSRAMNTTPADGGIRIGCEDRHRQANHEARER